MSKNIYDNAIKHMLEMKFANQYIMEFYKYSLKIITDNSSELIINSLKSIDKINRIIDEINRMLDKIEKFELIIPTISKLDALEERILNILDDKETCDLIMTISLCNNIEELYKNFKDIVAEIIEDLLKFSIIPELTNMINDLNKKIRDLESSSVCELLDKDNNSRSYRFTNDEEDKYFISYEQFY